MTVTLPIASPQFLFEEICRAATEEAEYHRGEFGLFLVVSKGAVDRIETLLRGNTSRHDRFVRLDDATLAVVAVAEQAGLDAMERRLRRLLEEARCEVRVARAIFPHDADDPARLLDVARRRCHTS